MGKLAGVKDRRKYQRVVVDMSEQLHLVVEGHGEALVFDMSYSGAAISQPKSKAVDTTSESLTLHLKTTVDQATVPATIIRVGEDVIALSFDKISVDARIIIDRLVTDRIVGLNMQKIDPKYYSQNVDFTHWFHGPRDTNLYLWEEKGQLTRAQLELDSCSLIFSEDGFFFENKTIQGAKALNNQQITLKALAIVEQMDQENDSLIQFKKSLVSHAQ